MGKLRCLLETEKHDKVALVTGTFLTRNRLYLEFQVLNQDLSFLQISASAYGFSGPFTCGSLLDFKSKSFPQSSRFVHQRKLILKCCSTASFSFSAQVWNLGGWLHVLNQSVANQQIVFTITSVVSDQNCIPAYIQAQVADPDLTIRVAKASAWCLVAQRIIYGNVPYAATLVSSYQSDEIKNLLAFESFSNLPYCNWLINQPFLGVNVPGFETAGTPIQVEDLQGAIWAIMNEFVIPNPPLPLPFQPQNVMYLVDQARRYGKDFIPTLPSQQILIALKFVQLGLPVVALSVPLSHLVLPSRFPHVQSLTGKVKQNASPLCSWFACC